MGAIISFVVGYIMGTRAGEKGFEELRDAWNTISTSAEVRAMLSGGKATASDLLDRGKSMIADRLEDSGSHLSRVA
jgi:hypothetical protein